MYNQGINIGENNMDGIQQNGLFGSLTARTNSVPQKITFDFKDLNIEELDLDNDGLLSDEELMTAVNNNQIDIVELSTTDADADQKVTEEQYLLWQQVEEMDNLIATFKEQAARDLAGEASEDIMKFTDKLTEFEDTFKNNYATEHNGDISQMAKDFKEALLGKFKEIKADVLSNTKSAIKARAVDDIIKDFQKEDSLNGNTFANKINKSIHGLSDNAIRLLNKILTAEADRFLKAYKGENLEKDLKAHLNAFLKTTEKDQLAEAIGIWDMDGDEAYEVSETEVERLQKFKKKAKNLLLSALENNIFLKIGDITVRSESAILPAIAQFKDSDSLRWAVNKAINELSRKTRIEEIIEADNAQSVSETPLPESSEMNSKEVNLFE